MKLHSTEEALRWLDTSGASLSPQDRQTLKVRATPRAWLVPVKWNTIENVVVALPDRFPYVLPEVMLPLASREGAIIPHVTPDDGFICYAPESSFIDPSQSKDMVIEALNFARAVVEKQYTSEELEREVQRELMPYWRFTPEFSLVLVEPDKIPAMFSLQQKGEYIFPHPLDRKHPESFKQIGFSLSCPASEALEMIQRPEVWLSSHRDLANRIQALEGIAGPGGIPVKKCSFYFLITVALAAGPAQLSARLGDIRLPRSAKTADESIHQTITTALANGKVDRGAVTDLSTARLMRRTRGDCAIDLLTKRVAIIGCGSLGGFIADNLARAGVRIFFLMDRENLEAPNVPRHCADFRELGNAKMIAVKNRIEKILPDAEVMTCGRDLVTNEALAELKQFNSDLVIFATGNTTTEVFVDELRAAGELPNSCFTWVEARLAAAHLLFCPTGVPAGFSQLIDPSSGQYVHRELRDAQSQIQQESGCQTAFAPYSGLDLVIAAGIISRQIVKWLLAAPVKCTILKFRPGDFALEDVTADRIKI
jgi:hypothetical protein